MIRSLKPTELRTIEIDPKMFRRCLSETTAVGQEMGTNVTCVVGESRWKIKRLQKSAYDLIYIDACARPARTLPPLNLCAGRTPPTL
jgi:predicted O-methyltransferase YrrM|mmetsp:Transcript_12462/g.31602  ORF Transcript_12462/g.31602 Transcript_12462/m.31602 type:complete len:87 (-) Transcript_12462:580-840(-)